MYVQPEKPDEIFHYGVKRRSGRYPWGSGERPYQGEEFKVALSGLARPRYFRSERIIPKGTKMYRTSISKNDLKEGNHTYVTYLEPERNLYKDGYIRYQNKGDTSYEYQMTLKEDLKIPSREVYKDSIKKVIEENPNYLRESLKTYYDTIFPSSSPQRGWLLHYKLEVENYNWKRWDEVVDKLIDKHKNEDVEETWGKMTISFGLNDKFRNAVISDLKNKGYNAMVDEASVGGRPEDNHSIEGVDPLIVFDSSVLKMDKIEKVSEEDEKKAKEKYQKWVSNARLYNSKTNRWEPYY